MDIAPETMALARRLVATETHGRRLLLLLHREPRPRGDVVDKEFVALLTRSRKLPRDLVRWTASTAVQGRDSRTPKSHIDMMCYMSDFNKGIADFMEAYDLFGFADTRAMPGGREASTKLVAIIRNLNNGMEYICGAHVGLRNFCNTEPRIPIPEFPTTRDGGGR